MSKKSVTVIIPTKNEEKSVIDVIKWIPKKYELLVIDAHSDDNTVKAVKSLGVKVIYDNGKGKGAALRISGKYAKSDIIVFIDADGSHDPKDISKLVSPLEKNEADMVVASRTLGGSAELSGTFEKNLRRFLSWCIDIIINLRFRSRITDAQNGFRAFNRNVFLDLDLKENVFSIEQEMVMKCLKKGYRIVEAPSYEHARKYGESNISLWRHGPKYLWCVLKNIW